MLGFLASLPILTRIAIFVSTVVAGFAAGWVINGWRLEANIASLKASHAQEVSGYYQAARKAEKELIEATEAIRREKDAEIEDVNNKLQSLTKQLRQRKARPSSPAPTRDCKGTTGAELSREDAEFLAREAARADQIRSALEHCYKQYDAVRGSIIRTN